MAEGLDSLSMDGLPSLGDLSTDRREASRLSRLCFTEDCVSTGDRDVEFEAGTGTWVTVFVDDMRDKG